MTDASYERLADALDDAPDIVRERCIGCGLCVTTCAADALALEPVSPEEWFDVPSSFEEWEERRLEFLKQPDAQAWHHR